jgi:hypothetical protein
VDGHADNRVVWKSDVIDDTQGVVISDDGAHIFVAGNPDVYKLSTVDGSRVWRNIPSPDGCASAYSGCASLVLSKDGSLLFCFCPPAVDNPWLTKVFAIHTSDASSVGHGHQLYHRSVDYLSTNR